MKYLLIIISLSILIACERVPNISPVRDLSGMVLNGPGTAYLPDGSFYDGEFKQGLFSGQGSLVWNNGESYIGEFRFGQMHGKGYYASAMGFSYEGEFANGLWQGRGEYIDKRGQRYTGEFELGDFHGHGKYVNTEGDVYEGEFRHGKPDGEIVLSYKKGARYVGTMKDWAFHGEGRYSLDDVTYAGHFINGQQEGVGVIERVSGRYQGEIQNWTEHGKGKWVSNDGNVYKGDFADGIFHGWGRYESVTGNVYEGEFENGMYHGKGEARYANAHGDKKVRRGYWEFGRYIGTRLVEDAHSKPEPNYVIEEVMYQQPRLLATHLDNLKPQQPGVTDLYFMAFAPYGEQDVFMNEAKLSASLFDKYYHTNGRSLTLINNPKTLETVPMATRSNLRTSLKHIAGLIDKDEDIVFLFLTSHGSKQHQLSVNLRGVQLKDISAEQLKQDIEQTGIKWKVVVISACYSGGFIEHLQDPYTMVITAASSDRVSFGCADETDLTYFGRAFLKDSLSRNANFHHAFIRAKGLVTKWEQREGYSSSEPQIYVGEAIEQKLKQWQKGSDLAAR